jgi:hypothetical protein
VDRWISRNKDWWSDPKYEAQRGALLTSAPSENFADEPAGLTERDRGGPQGGHGDEGGVRPFGRREEALQAFLGSQLDAALLALALGHQISGHVGAQLDRPTPYDPS